MKEKHGVPDAQNIATATGTTQHVDVIDGDGIVLLHLSKGYPAGLTPEQARYISKRLKESADRVENKG